MKQPFFSIPIATYNRSSDLDFAIKRILSQSFKDFELIISDDNSPDDTEKIVKKYKDSRIRYVRNKKNLGAVPNIGKVLALSHGKYIFMHGDDDYLLYDDILEKAANLLKKHKYGLIRFNYLYQSFDKKDVFDFFRYKSKIKKLAFHLKDPIEVLSFIEKIDLYFITGITFENIYPKKVTITDSELIPWFKICFQSITKRGGYFDSNYYIVASWSHQAIHPVYYVRDGKLTFETYYDELRKLAGESYYRKALYKQLEVSVNNLPTIKYNSNNSNLLQYAKRILELNPSYKISVKFYTLLILAYILPKSILKIVRYVYIKRMAGNGKISNVETIRKAVMKVRGYQ